MRIVRCDSSHAAAWDAFVDASPTASFYHRFAWKGINERALDHHTAFLAAFDAGGVVVGVLPVVHVQSWLFGNIACSMPFVNYGGPCAESPQIEAALLDEAARICEEWKVDYLEIRSRRDLGDRFPSARHKVSITLDLQPDPDIHWKAFKTGHRQEIRRGYKHGLDVRIGGAELFEPFFEVLTESWRNLGTPLYNRHYFETILKAFPASTRLCVVFSGSEPAAAAFDGIHRDTMEGMWMGSKAKFRHQLVGYVLYWELIKNACERGFRHFHLGRSTADSGSETFKKKWNASTEQLYWHYLLRTTSDIPSLNVSNPKYQRAINAWRRLPIGVTRLIGHSIARNIP